MAQPLRFVLAIHNHQPIGNFDPVVEQAYQDSYLPFLRTLARYPKLRISLHLSGSLFDWLTGRHPEYLDAVSEMIRNGQIELLGGAYYEPILPMLPRRDRRGQINSFSEALERRFGQAPLGIWLSERVWEQNLTSDLAVCAIEHTVLDDFHFKNVGLSDDQLHGYYLTEDDGHLLAVFPGSEQLRYLIPFAPPEQTIDYLRMIAQTHPGAVVVYGDDGEKFGTWPGMKQHVHDEGWLVRFCEALSANADWLQVCTLGDAVNHVSPLGKVYLPEASYREMTEWASLCGKQASAPRLDLSAPQAGQTMAPGFWRNFRVKYPEADEMYTRMLTVSNRLQMAVQAEHEPRLLSLAQKELYRGQCNCGYWHGTFGGVYLPHLRQAVYRHLIAAENLLDRAADRPETWIEVAVEDFNLDVHKEVRLGNDKLIAWLAPAHGGQLYGLEVRGVCHNLLATLTRRPEMYHRQLAPTGPSGTSKTPGLEQHLQYDSHPRKSLIDHFYDQGATLADVASGHATELGDFVAGRYEARLHRDDDHIRVQLVRQGHVSGQALRIVKCLTLTAGSPTLEVEYQLHGLPADRTFHFGVEFNFAGLPGDRADRYFRATKRKQLGLLGQALDLAETKTLSIVDDYLGLDVGLNFSRACQLWTFPLHSVNQSERGLELVQQSVVVVPHWHVRADARGCWNVTIGLPLTTAHVDRKWQQLFGKNHGADLGVAEMARALLDTSPRQLVHAA